MIAALALAALIAGPAGAAEPPLLEVVSRRTIDPRAYLPASAPAKITVPLALVVEESSGWEAPGLLERALGKASGIFAQCGVSLGSAEVLTVRWSAEALRRLNADDPYAGPSKMTVMGEPLLPARRPLGFLFGNTIASYAQDYAAASPDALMRTADPEKAGLLDALWLGYSIPSVAEAYNHSSVDLLKGAHPEAADLLDTFWMTIDVQTRPRRPAETEGFSVLAHELTHILGNLPHESAHPNLMNVDGLPGYESGDLLEGQCAEIRRLR